MKEENILVPNKGPDRVPPDGGWGWVIVCAVFIGNCLMDGCIGSFGIFYPELLRAFGSSPFVTSMAGSLLPAVYMISSPVVGSLSLKYGSRPVCFVGGCIGAVGFILASVSNNMAILMISFVIVGVGIGMNYLPGHVITNNYFDKRRGIAGGIVCAGAGFGVFILAPVSQILLTEYGWRGAMVIISGLFLQLCVCSTMMRPLSTQTKIKDLHSNSQRHSEYHETESMLKPSNRHDKHTVSETKCLNGVSTNIKHEEDDDAQNHALDFKKFKLSNKDPLIRLKQTDRCYSDHLLTAHKPDTGQVEVKMLAKSLQDLKKQPVVKTPIHVTMSQFLEPVALIAQSQQIVQENQQTLESNQKRRRNIRENLRTWKIISCDMSIFRDKSYVPLLLGGIFIQMGQFIPNTFLPEYCLSIGLGGGQISIIMALYGAVNILGRLSAGCLANIKTVDALWLCNLGMFMCGIGCALFSFCTTFTSLCIYATGFGYFIGYFPPLQILIMVEYLGIEKLPSALGFLQMAKGPAALFGPPLAGLVYQYSEDYTMSLGFAGILFLLAALIQSLVPLSSMCLRCKKETNLSSTSIDIFVD